MKNHVRVLCISCKFLGEWKKVSFVSKLGNVTKFSKNSLKGLELRLSESAAVFELERDGCMLAWVLERAEEVGKHYIEHWSNRRYIWLQGCGVLAQPLGAPHSPALDNFLEQEGLLELQK